MDDEHAIEGLKHLGLRTYEARVFLALQKLGSGTANEVSEVAEVPRSQVYGAAEGLEDRGLVETQQSTPTVYRPAPLERARQQLLDRLAETGEETFDYLETVRNSAADQEHPESIWLINGSDAIASRAVSVAEDATDRLLYATEEPGMLEPDLLATMKQAAENGVAVVVASIDPAILAAVPDSIGTYRVSEERDMDVNTGRLVVADNATILLSTFAPDTANGDHEEVAFWAAENTFAMVLTELAEGWLQGPFR